MNRGVKTIMAGDAGVGKTSIVHRVSTDIFPRETSSTIGASFNIKRKEINGDTVKLEIWDTGGQERYRSLVPMYIRDSLVIVLCYDISDTYHDICERVKYWMAYICDHLSESAQKIEPLVFVVGNKQDLMVSRVGEDAYKKIENDINELVQNIIQTEKRRTDLFLPFPLKVKHFVISAKSGYNFDELWDCIAKDSINEIKNHEYVQITHNYVEEKPILTSESSLQQEFVNKCCK